MLSEFFLPASQLDKTFSFIVVNFLLALPCQMWKFYFDYINEFPVDNTNKVLFLMNMRE